MSAVAGGDSIESGRDKKREGAIRELQGSIDFTEWTRSESTPTLLKYKHHLESDPLHWVAQPSILTIRTSRYGSRSGVVKCSGSQLLHVAMYTRAPRPCGLGHSSRPCLSQIFFSSLLPFPSSPWSPRANRSTLSSFAGRAR
jgi:hypothetical protein